MKLSNNILTLYAVTNFDPSEDEMSISDKVTETINGGITCIQLREKTLPYEQFLKRALLIRKLCKERDVLFIINDNVKIAVGSDVDGVHIGQHDLNIAKARKLTGNKILGVSVQTVDQAIEAEKYGADYLGVGSIFPTQTKKDSSIVFIGVLKQIVYKVHIPVIAIGGLNLGNIERLKNSGISGIAVSAAIFSANDIEKQTRDLLNLSKKVMGI